MERRIFVAIAISIAFLWLWAAIAPRIFPELARPPATATRAGDAIDRSAGEDTRGPGRTPSATTATVPAAPAVVAAPRRDVKPVAAAVVRETVVESSDYIARFSNRGAQLVSWQLKNYRRKDGEPVDLVKRRPANQDDYPFAIVAQSGAVARRLNSALYSVEQYGEKGASVIEYRYVAPDGLSATKTFRVSSDFVIEFAISVEPALPYRVVIGPGIRNIDASESQSQSALLAGNALVQQDGDLDVENREKGDRLRIFERVEFIGIEDNYFLAALVPERAGAATLRRVEVPGPDGKPRKELYAGINAAPNGVVTGSAFFGPKEPTVLERHGLGKALQYGMFGVIARFLLEGLLWINNYTRNYGFAIIVLTILIKVVLYPLQHKSIVSMKRMQRVQPKMEAIKNKYKKSRTDPEQRQKMNTEMMKLYQVEGINPMSGCLPILLQLPVLWGFYNLLSRAIELRGAPWILWIRDLSEKDPTYILPILMTGTMFIQTYITPMTADPMQRKIFLAMPLVFGIMFKEFPSGLVLYWLVQNILTIIQQTIMNKWWKDHPAEVAKA
ncbi:MAG TPA: membrane protein insertase YidC [Thermoanaerobaculia bacterium]|nr:membrane protein insertase YidC [Thermoanaerobaculia bacterium]